VAIVYRSIVIPRAANCAGEVARCVRFARFAARAHRRPIAFAVCGFNVPAPIATCSDPSIASSASRRGMCPL